MSVASSVRFFHSDMFGAPQINAVAGDLIGILDACLIDGFGSKSVNSILVAGGVATVNISSGHDFEVYSVVRISGADQAELNGDWQVTTADASNLTFACPGVSDQSATGTITASRATPGYWEKSFSGTNKAAFRSTHPDNAGFLLRIDDSAPGTGKSPVRGYEAMADIDNGDAAFPTVSQAGDLYWLRSSTTSAANLPRPWSLICDSQFFWFLLAIYPGFYSVPFMFGRLVSGAPTDIILTACEGSYVGNQSTILAPIVRQGEWIARGADPSIVVPTLIRRLGVANMNSDLTLYGGGEAFPSIFSSGYVFNPSVIVQSEGRTRGLLPCLQGLTSAESTLPLEPGTEPRRMVISPTSLLPRPLFMTDVIGPSYSGVSYLTFDIQGPWR
jgi:hypothetical protein